MLKGKGEYIWKIRDCENAIVSDIVTMAKNANFSHVLIKIADGPYGYNYIDGVDKAKELAIALLSEGIEPWGWQYVYGADPVGEALTAKRRMRETGCVGFVINGEVEIRDNPDNVVNASLYNSYLGLDVPIALSTYRYPNSHPAFPYKEFLKICSLVMPQVYWMKADNPVEQLGWCIEQYEAITDLPIFPTGSAFCEHGWCPTTDEIKQFAQAAKDRNLPGINFWEWSATRADGFWKTVRDIEWDVEPPPPPVDCCEELKYTLDNYIEAHSGHIHQDIQDAFDYINERLDNKATKVKLEELREETMEIGMNAELGYKATKAKLEEAIDGFNNRITLLEMAKPQDVEARLMNEIAKLKEDFENHIEAEKLALGGLREQLEKHNHLFVPNNGTFWQRLKWLFGGKNIV